MKMKATKMGLLGSDEPDVEMARKWLSKAIDRHMRHLNGDEPTTEESQEKLMDEMQAAMSALGK